MQWISPKQKLPEPDRTVAVYTQSYQILTGRLALNDDEWTTSWEVFVDNEILPSHICEPIFWCDLPDLPKVEDDYE